MQDEPGGRGCFAYKMSLKGSVMLGIDDQSELHSGDEPGRDPGFFESQRGSAFRGREKGGGLRLGERVLGTAEVGRVGAYGVVRVAESSVAQIYRIRKSAGYRKQRVVYQGAGTVTVAIGERRAPQ